MLVQLAGGDQIADAEQGQLLLHRPAPRGVGVRQRADVAPAREQGERAGERLLQLVAGGLDLHHELRAHAALREGLPLERAEVVRPRLRLAEQPLGVAAPLCVPVQRVDRRPHRGRDRHGGEERAEGPDGAGAGRGLFRPAVASRAVAALAGVLDTTLRVDDLRGRFDEERFGVLLSEARADSPALVASRIARAFAALSFEGEAGPVLPPGLRIGLASMPDDGVSVPALAASASRRRSELSASVPRLLVEVARGD